MSEQLEVMTLPTVQGFLQILRAHAGPNAPLGPWPGPPVADANRLAEAYVKTPLEGGLAQRLQHHYQHWCYGHVGDVMEEMVQLPGAVVFRAGAGGRFEDAAYLYRKTGPGLFDWDIFICRDGESGLQLVPMGPGWTHWGLNSMVMRYNLPGPMTRDLQPPPPGTPYGVVWSSVLNFRRKGDRKLVTSVPNGTVLPLTGEIDGDWTGCLLGGLSGYVFGKFLVRHENPAPTCAV